MSGEPDAIIEGDGGSAPSRRSSSAEGSDEDDAADGVASGDEGAKGEEGVAGIAGVCSEMALLAGVVVALGVLGATFDDTQIGGTSSGNAHAMSLVSSLSGSSDGSLVESVVAVAAVTDGIPMEPTPSTNAPESAQDRRTRSAFGVASRTTHSSSTGTGGVPGRVCEGSTGSRLLTTLPRPIRGEARETRLRRRCAEPDDCRELHLPVHFVQAPHTR